MIVFNTNFCHPPPPPLPNTHTYQDPLSKGKNSFLLTPNKEGEKKTEKKLCTCPYTCGTCCLQGAFQPNVKCFSQSTTKQCNLQSKAVTERRGEHQRKHRTKEATVHSLLRSVPQAASAEAEERGRGWKGRMSECLTCRTQCLSNDGIGG